MSIQFRFYFDDPGERRSGFDLGHMAVEGGNASVSSQREGRSMMVFIAVVNLLDGVRRFLDDTQARRYRFVGADSSFQIEFTKLGERDELRVAVGSVEIGQLRRGELVRALLDGASQFTDQYLPHLPQSDSVRGDITSALSEFLTRHRQLS